MQRTISPLHLFIFGCLGLLACLAMMLVGAVGYFILADDPTPEVAIASPAPLPTMTTPLASAPTPLPPTAVPASPTATTLNTNPSFGRPTVANDDQNSKLQPTPLPTLAVNPPAAIIQQPVPPYAAANLDALLGATYPPHNYFDAVERLALLDLGSRTVTKPSYEVGDRETFFAGENKVEAKLMAATDHAYFWVETSLNFDQEDVDFAAEQLESYYYPLVSDLFGEAWQPGVDNDPHFSILHLDDVDNSDELGYFTDLDEYPRTLYSDSNEQEMIYLNMSQLELNEDLYFGTLVHEMQHLSQWHIDPNETAWLNEGISQLVELYVGLDTVDTAPYLEAPEVGLNSWSYDEQTIDAHYANAYLFSVYFWEQLGETAVRELVRHPANGLAAVWDLLPKYDARSLSEFVLDWAVAVYLDDPTAGTAYGFTELDLERPSFIHQIRLPNREITGTLDPFGVHYYDLFFPGLTTITFVGDTTATLFDDPTNEHGTVWFAADDNEVNGQLTAVFDLHNLNTATLTFDAWYDLEEEWDFGYVSVSTDGGDNWELLLPGHAVEGTYGPGFNGRSADTPDAHNGWVSETIYLDDYAGQLILLRFELFTDSSGPSRGLALDNIAIDELGYSTTVDDNQGEWTAVGFVQTEATLAQQWGVAIIQYGEQTQVTQLPLNSFNQGQWTVELGPGGGTLVLIPLTPFIDTPANYWLKVQ